MLEEKYIKQLRLLVTFLIVLLGLLVFAYVYGLESKINQIKLNSEYILRDLEYIKWEIRDAAGQTEADITL